MTYPLKAISYQLNLIDTPGHSDFGYEVSRALMAVEGAILLVDATQGIQAQTLANFEQAKKSGLTIIGAVNKVDVAPEELVKQSTLELASLLEIEESEVLKVSGKTGLGVSELLQRVIEKVPPPSPAAAGPKGQALQSRKVGHSELSNVSKALIFDSKYDDHKGIMAFIRVFNGEFMMLGKDDSPYILLATGEKFKPKEVGIFTPQFKAVEKLSEGEIGYIATGIKDPDKLKIGDTIASSEKSELLPGFKEPKPVVFVSFYPSESDEYENLKTAFARLRLNDSSIQYESDTSEVLGRGFKAGFLGRLHFEIAAERLEKEFNIETVHSFPSVAYNVQTKSGWEIIKNPKDFPSEYFGVEEPIARIEILVPGDYLGGTLQLSQNFRLRDIETKNFGSRIIVIAKISLSDLIQDFDDQLKSVTQGYASLNYEIIGYEKADVKKIEIFVASHLIPGLTRIMPREDIEREGRKMVERLKDLLPKEQFTQALQASVDGKIIARETIPAMHKLLGSFGKTGGDRTRKMKLWKKQQKGKKKLKEIAEKSQVKIPASVFKELLKK